MDKTLGRPGSLAASALRPGANPDVTPNADDPNRLENMYWIGFKAAAHAGRRPLGCWIGREPVPTATSTGA